MGATKEELLKIKGNYLQKQSSFYTACIYQIACIKKIKKLDTIPVSYDSYKEYPSYSLFLLLDKRLMHANDRLIKINYLLSKTKTISQLKYYIDQFQIDNIDKDLKSAMRITNKFLKSNMHRGYISSESLNSLEQTTYLLCQLYTGAINQLQYCIDIIDSSLSLEKPCDMQK